MADRQLIVKIIGDSGSLERAFRRSGTASRGFGRDLERSGRGALAASLSFRGLGRSLTFASAQFLGGAGIVFALKQVVDQASRVQEETEKTGIVFGRSARQVQDWARTLANSFGISEGAALEATGRFGNMLRPLGFGEKAAAKMSERLVQLAADMASFNNQKPDVTLEALSSGLAGQVRPLRQFGVFLSQARIQEEALADGIARHGQKLTQAQKVQAAYNIILKDTRQQQGDVARNTESLSVAQSKLTASVQDLEARLGKALLPSITAYVNKAAAWLSQTKNQERIQRDLTDAAHAAVAVIKALATIFDVLRALLAPVVRSFGGLKNTLVALGLVLVTSRLIKMVAALRSLATAETLAAGRATLLGARLRSLPAKITIGVVIASEISGPLKKLLEQGLGADFSDITPGGDFSKFKAGHIVQQIDGSVVVIGPDHRAYSPEEFQRRFGVKAIAKRMSGAAGRGTVNVPVSGGRRPRITVEQRNTFFDAAIGRERDLVQDQSTIQGQIAALQKIAAKIQARIKATKDVTRRLTLEGNLRDVFREIKSDREQLAANIKQASADAWQKVQDALAADRERAEKVRQQQQARQFRALGLGPTGDAITPGVENLRKQLASITRRISGTPLDTSRLRSQLAGIRKVLSGELGKATVDVRQKIQELFATIRQGLSDGAKKLGTETQFHKASVNAILSGLGLNPDQIRGLRARLSQVGRGGTVPSRGPAAFGVALAGSGGLSGTQVRGEFVIENQVILDGRPIASNTTRRQQQRRRRNPPQKRGPLAGV